MAQYTIKATGHDRHTDWTTSVKIGEDNDGNDIIVGVNVPAELNKDQKDLVENLGYELETINKEDAQKLEDERASSVGADTAGASPLLGDDADDSARKGETDKPNF